jgi:hypothetical protein
MPDLLAAVKLDPASIKYKNRFRIKHGMTRQNIEE